MNNRVSTILLAGVLVTAIFSCNSDSKTLSGENTDGSGKEKKLKGTVSISGAFALYPLVNVWAEEFRKEYPDVRFNISGSVMRLADYVVFMYFGEVVEKGRPGVVFENPTSETFKEYLLVGH